VKELLRISAEGFDLGLLAAAATADHGNAVQVFIDEPVRRIAVRTLQHLLRPLVEDGWMPWHEHDSFPPAASRRPTRWSVARAMKQRKKIGMNDVAFGDWRGDYGAFVTQLDASETRSWWGVGSSGGGGALPLGGPFFDRLVGVWADPANASTALTLKFDARLRGGLLLTAGGGEGAPANLSVRLLFLGNPPTPVPSASRLRMARSRGVRPSREWTGGLNKAHKPKPRQ
jgi:hypothetical protein